MNTFENTNNKEIQEQPFSKTELEYYKNLLMSKREAALKDLEMIESSLYEARENPDDDTPYSAHMADVGSDEQNRVTLYMLHKRTKKYINSLDRALQRIENGTYGFCSVTGKRISRGRLEAVPHTTVSIEAKLNKNQSN